MPYHDTDDNNKNNNNNNDNNNDNHHHHRRRRHHHHHPIVTPAPPKAHRFPCSAKLKDFFGTQVPGARMKPPRDEKKSGGWLEKLGHCKQNICVLRQDLRTMYLFWFRLRYHQQKWVWRWKTPRVILGTANSVHSTGAQNVQCAKPNA